MPNLTDKSLTSRYQRGLECQGQPFNCFPEGPREPLRIVKQKAHLKMSQVQGQGRIESPSCRVTSGFVSFPCHSLCHPGHLSCLLWVCFLFCKAGMVAPNEQCRESSVTLVQLPSYVRLFATQWTAARQASLSFTEFAQTQWTSLIQWCHPTISSSVGSFSSCPRLSQHQGLFQWVSSLHQMAKVLELQHQSFQWIFRVH